MITAGNTAQSIDEAQRNTLLRRYLEQPRTFHEALVYHMKDRHVTLEQLAYATDIPIRTLTRWRNEEQGSYAPERLIRIFRCLKLEPILCYSMFRKAGIQLSPSDPEDLEFLKAFEAPAPGEDEDEWLRL